jgi:hypothetical protein
VALDTYANLSTAIGSWEERTFTSGDTDEFILLAEAKANRRLVNDYRVRSGIVTVTTNSSGVATLPSGYVGMVSLTRDLAGSVPLRQVPHGALVEINPYEESDDARAYSLLDATTLQVAPIIEDDFNALYSKTIPGLSGSNTTNWLLTLAPDYYLFACQAAAAAKFKAYQEAAMLQAQADAILEEVVSLGNVAEFASAEMRLEQVA